MHNKEADFQPRAALLFLMLAYVLNFADRQIVSILAVPIKADLNLTDTQLGLMGGLAFALFYSILGIPIAYLADRRSRVKIITVAIGLWSFFTAICGMAQSFWQLFFARMFVGVGEAGFVSPAYSLITDYFPRSGRGRALAIFQFGIPIGSALGVFLGGWISENINWRVAFFVLGLSGLPLALLIQLKLKEPVRGGKDKIQNNVTTPAPAFLSVVGWLLKTPSFWFLSFGAASNAMLLFGLMFWLPSFLQRSFSLTLTDLSVFYGFVIIIGGLVGIWAGGYLADRFGQNNPRVYALIPAVSFLLAGPGYAMGIFATDLVWVFIFLCLGQALGLIGAAPIITAIQHIVPPSMRATASAVFVLLTNLVGLGMGTLFVGMVSDFMITIHGSASLKYAIFYSLVFYPLSALLLALAAWRIKRDWLTE